MIQNRTHEDRKVEGNLAGLDIKMQVGDLSHILNVLTDLYSDRELACIREYSTNAWDAHVEAGVTSPIEVTTPTPLSPFLTIRDFGIGLSLDDIREVYSQYGVSTKRSTNEQNGMLGLGCKSALTYADQFTVTSVKDGVRVQVVVSRNTMGASMKVVDTADTDDPNGTTITIPARFGNQIDKKARRFFSFWEEGRVLLNGQPTEKVPGAKWVTDKLALVDADYGSEHYGHTDQIVMGGVAYPAPNLRTGLGSYTKLIAFVDIGDVDFAPSREGLMDTDTTTATLDRVAKELVDAIKQSVLDDIASAQTPLEAVKRRQDWYSKLPHGMVPTSTPYKGKPVPDGMDVPDGSIIAQYHARKISGHSKLSKHAPLPNILNALWVVGYDHASFTATTKKKLWKYCEDNNLSYPHFILSKDKPSTYWIEGGVDFIDWPTIKALKLPKNAVNPTTGRIPGSYDLYEDGDYNEGVPADDIDTSNDIFWMFGKYYDGRRYVEFLKEYYPGATLVMLRSGREGKFQRVFPSSRKIDVVLQEEFDKWAKTITADTRLAIAVQNDYTFADYEKLDLSKLDDPRFAKIAKLRKRNLNAIKEKISYWHKLGMYFQTGQHGVENPIESYPLLPDGYYLNRRLKDPEEGAHIYRYMNAEYAHLVAEGKL